MKFSLFLMILLSLPSWAKWSVTTYNIRNFDEDPWSGRTDVAELGKIIREVKSDVMVFEEVSNETAFSDLIKKNLKGYSYKISSCGGFGRQFLAVVYNPNTFDFINELEDLTFSGNSQKCGSLRPLFLVTLLHKESKKRFTFGAVHLKAGGDQRAFRQRWAQYKKLGELSKKYQKENLILLGDFNTTGYNIKNEDFVQFESFMSDARLRATTENIECTNYWQGTLGGEKLQPSMLDHIVIQDKNVSQIEEVKVSSHCAKMNCLPATPETLGKSYQKVSDHCPVQLTFK